MHYENKEASKFPWIDPKLALKFYYTFHLLKFDQSPCKKVATIVQILTWSPGLRTRGTVFSQFSNPALRSLLQFIISFSIQHDLSIKCFLWVNHVCPRKNIKHGRWFCKDTVLRIVHVSVVQIWCVIHSSNKWVFGIPTTFWGINASKSIIGLIQKNFCKSNY